MIFNKHYSVIIVAGGKGLRVGGEIPKQFQFIAGKPMLMRTVEAFYRFDAKMRIVIVLPKEFRELWTTLCAQHGFEIAHKVVLGGKTRFHSVKNGLSEIPDDEIVGIHDAARPFVSLKTIETCYRQASEEQCGSIPVVEEKNSVRLLSDSGSKALDRTQIRIVQTPQVFPAVLLKEAYQTEFFPHFTDDASVAEYAGITIRLVEGDEANTKITTAWDLKLANLIFSEKAF